MPNGDPRDGFFYHARLLYSSTPESLVMTNGDPEGRIFLSYPHTHDRFLLYTCTAVTIRNPIWNPIRSNFNSLHFMLCLSSAYLFQKDFFSNKSFNNTIKLLNGLDPDQDWVQSVGKGYPQMTKVAASKEELIFLIRHAIEA